MSSSSQQKPVAVDPGERPIRTVEDAKEFLGIQATDYEWEMVRLYLDKGIRPDPGGCWHCLEAAARRITGWIDYYNSHGGISEGMI